MYQFRIDQNALKSNGKILYFQDANASNSQHHASQRTIDEAKLQVQRAFARLNGAPFSFIPVIFENPERPGYLIEYAFAGGSMGQFPVAGLPVRPSGGKRADGYTEKSRIQALMIAADILDATANAQRHIPLSNPLLLHLMADGKQTIAQMIAERQELPTTFLITSGEPTE